MNTLLLRKCATALVAGLFALLASGCAVYDGGGYGYRSSVGIGIDYYEPFGGEYGGWGPGYRVAPFRGGSARMDRGGEHRRDRAGGHPGGHAYRSAPPSRSMPSIPSRPGRSRSH